MNLVLNEELLLALYFPLIQFASPDLSIKINSVEVIVKYYMMIHNDSEIKTNMQSIRMAKIYILEKSVFALSNIFYVLSYNLLM